jgi:DNA polymerase sigma
LPCPALIHIDQRSIKVIERTAVPVIKVSTKDSRSKIVQLDLSFDAKEHHGLEALDMIRHLLEENPIIRPLVLVLKQFLLDRGLLTAYTGKLLTSIETSPPPIHTYHLRLPHALSLQAVYLLIAFF